MKRLVERALAAELTAHLGYASHARQAGDHGNYRNGTSTKTVQLEAGPCAIMISRDRNANFEPQSVKKRQRHLEGFDEKVLALYS